MHVFYTSVTLTEELRVKRLQEYERSEVKHSNKEKELQKRKEKTTPLRKLARSKKQRTNVSDKR